LALTGALTLNGGPDSVWVFQTPSTLITASNSSIVFTGGANACNVFWQVGSSATLGTDSSFAGTIMALTSISMTTRATLTGRALARNGAVTLDTNTITQPTCAAAPPTDTPTTPPPGGPGDDDDDNDGGNGGPGGGGGAGDDDNNGGPGGGAGDDDNNGGPGGGGGAGDDDNNGGPGGGGGAGDDGVQVTEIPSGAVDTGVAAQTTGSDRAVLTGSALAAGAGVLALVAVRRRRSM
jgi:hypothetical protein